MDETGWRRTRRLRRGATAVATEILGTPVGVALPVQRHAPHHVLVWCGIELGAFALFALTGSVVALGVVGAAGAALLVLAATNRRRVLAVTRSDVVVLRATLRGRPVAPLGRAPSAIELPQPRGVGAALDLEDGRWWVDRSTYPRLRRARELCARRAPGSG